MQTKKHHIVLTVLLPIQFIIITLLKSKSYFIENYYATKAYPIISKTLRLLLGWIPFSFGDVFALFLIGYVVYQLYLLFKNKFKSIIPFLTRITALLSVLYFCFYAFWGLNYFRKPLADKLNLTKSKYTNAQLLETGKKVANQLNKAHCNITQNDTIIVHNPLQNHELFDIAYDSYTNVSKTYPDLAYKNISVKKSLVSLMHMYTGTSGYFNPITSEAQINDKIPRTGLPATTCHEMAHQIGWSAENDANFVSFLTCTHSNNKYFKYAGYRMAFIYIIKELRKRDKELSTALWQNVNKGIIKDFQNSRQHWQAYKNPIEPYIKKGYNSYLKANNQASGIQSYNYVVDLLIAYYKQHSI